MRACARVNWDRCLPPCVLPLFSSVLVVHSGPGGGDGQIWNIICCTLMSEKREIDRFAYKSFLKNGHFTGFENMSKEKENVYTFVFCAEF